MARTQYLEFYVGLTDQARVDELNAQYPRGYIVAPVTGAAIEFSAPWTGSTPPAAVNGTWSNYPDGSFPTNVATFTRSSGGLFGIAALFGQTTRYYWVARFCFIAPLSTASTVEIPVTPKPMPVRYWV